MLHNCDRKMRSIVNQPCDIVLGHLRELLLENTFQPRENHKAIARPVIIDHPEFDITPTLFENRGLE